jgi:hypothetical protein
MEQLVIHLEAAVLSSRHRRGLLHGAAGDAADGVGVTSEGVHHLQPPQRNKQTALT